MDGIGVAQAYAYVDARHVPCAYDQALSFLWPSARITLSSLGHALSIGHIP
jgi:hypothetical protein